MSGDVLARIRTICMAQPDATERLSHGEPAWFHRDKKLFVMFADQHHDSRVAVWCAAPPGFQEAMVSAEPDKFFRPPYVGVRGWLGVYLDVEVNWEEVADIISQAYQTIIPAKKPSK
ncbi:MAG: MmcQ/YjbR family DNA-binding protein [Armatimonadetes bacterium]|nr:MmcQ/YjbR family DNA-binding protein [Armatimonadota bacterium]